MPSFSSQLDIANLALSLINQKPITVLDNTTELSRQVIRWYDPMRRELLRACDWTFARKILSLNLIGQLTGIGSFPDWATAGTPSPNPSGVTANNAVFPWAFLYSYPLNVLFIQKVYNTNVYDGFALPGSEESFTFPGINQSWLTENKWEIVRSLATNELAIATNIDKAICKYTFDMTDTSQFDATFVTALAHKIAQRLFSLHGDKELKAMIDKDLQDVMTDAMRLNLSEYPEKGPNVSNYERARGIG